MNNQQRNYIRKECRELVLNALDELAKNADSRLQYYIEVDKKELQKEVTKRNEPKVSNQYLRVPSYYTRKQMINLTSTNQEILDMYEGIRETAQQTYASEVAKFKDYQKVEAKMNELLKQYHGVLKGLLFSEADDALSSMEEFEKVCGGVNDE